MVNLPNLPPPPKHPDRILAELFEKRDRTLSIINNLMETINKPMKTDATNLYHLAKYCQSCRRQAEANYFDNQDRLNALLGYINEDLEVGHISQEWHDAVKRFATTLYTA